jgi:hypothetical protein
MRAREYGDLSTEEFNSLWESARQAGRRLVAMIKSGNFAVAKPHGSGLRPHG